MFDEGRCEWGRGKRAEYLLVDDYVGAKMNQVLNMLELLRISRLKHAVNF
jgi:hypothetical protein